MPVPQENLSFVEQASCLLLTMVQDVSYQERRVNLRDRAGTPQQIALT
ncbi:hypothetical protein [Microcoleus vaginatus]|nr:hypothetical protein MicvaDRAFT_3870 [Microcoleus vaginatus FGP-2]